MSGITKGLEGEKMKNSAKLLVALAALGMTATGATLGKEDGFGLSYGLGARWAFTPQWAAVVEWERHKFKFSDGDAPVNLTTVGLQYRF